MRNRYGSSGAPGNVVASLVDSKRAKILTEDEERMARSLSLGQLPVRSNVSIGWPSSVDTSTFQIDYGPGSLKEFSQWLAEKVDLDSSCIVIPGQNRWFAVESTLRNFIPAIPEFLELFSEFWIWFRGEDSLLQVDADWVAEHGDLGWSR